MFVGHYAASLAAKVAEPRGPLWAYVAGAQLLDIGWSSLLMAGVEKMRIDTSLPGSPLDLYYMPYTHSLPAALAWSAAAAIIARPALKLPWSAALMIGATVFSHWVGDFLVHRPDLELFPHGAKVGLGFWNFPEPEMVLEMGLIAVTGAIWTASRKSRGQTAWPAVAFLTLLVAVQMLSSVLGGSSGSPDPFKTGAMALAVYLVLTLVAVFVDRSRAQRVA
jgi:hypothetical protein